MRNPKLLAGLILTLLVSACGRDNPAAPSGGSGVTVNGSLLAPGGSASTASARTSSVTSATLPAGITVTINGTNITVNVNGNGQFVLQNVPPGNVDLRIKGPGIDALLSLLELLSGQTVNITVTVNGSEAVVESDSRSRGREEQLEGRVESLPPTTAAGALVVSGRTVTTTASTVFVQNGASATFADLAIGQRVHVKGQTSGTSLAANEVKIQNTNTDIGLNISGLVSLFTGTRSAFQFTVDNRIVKGDANTEFYGNSDFADLANGKQADVKGSLRDGYVYATRIKVR